MSQKLSSHTPPQPRPKHSAHTLAIWMHAATAGTHSDRVPRLQGPPGCCRGCGCGGHGCACGPPRRSRPPAAGRPPTGQCAKAGADAITREAGGVGRLRPRRHHTTKNFFNFEFDTPQETVPKNQWVQRKETRPVKTGQRVQREGRRQFPGRSEDKN